MKSTNAVRTEIHYAQVGEYQLPLLTLPQTNDSEPLGKYGRMRLAYLKTQRPVLYHHGTHDDHSVRQVTPRRTKSAHSFSGRLI